MPEIDKDKHKRRFYGPWPDVATARLFLAGLVRPSPIISPHLRQNVPVPHLAEWLINQEIAGLARNRYGPSWPALNDALQSDTYKAVAEAGLHQEFQTLVAQSFQEAGIPLVFLKGAALAADVYGHLELRTMSDLDLWVQAAFMRPAVQALTSVGFAIHQKAERPFHLQQLAQGEIPLTHQGWQQGLVELHWSPFSGWWLKRTAVVDDTAVWERKEPLARTISERSPQIDGQIFQLSPEDMVIHVAVHQAVNHQLGMKAIQGLMDIVLTAEGRGVDWPVVAERARSWRVGTAVWLVLHLLDQLIGSPGVEIALERLRPSRFRRRLLQRLISAEKVLAGKDIRGSKPRYLLLLILVDRIQDMAYLIYRTMWPEKEWLQARYPDGGSRRHHLWQVVRYGRI